MTTTTSSPSIATIAQNLGKSRSAGLLGGRWTKFGIKHEGEGRFELVGPRNGFEDPAGDRKPALVDNIVADAGDEFQSVGLGEVGGSYEPAISGFVVEASTKHRAGQVRGEEE